MRKIHALTIHLDSECVVSGLDGVARQDILAGTLIDRCANRCGTRAASREQYARNRAAVSRHVVSARVAQLDEELLSNTGGGVCGWRERCDERLIRLKAIVEQHS